MCVVRAATAWPQACLTTARSVSVQIGDAGGNRARRLLLVLLLLPPLRACCCFCSCCCRHDAFAAYTSMLQAGA